MHAIQIRHRAGAVVLRNGINAVGLGHRRGGGDRGIEIGAIEIARRIRRRQRAGFIDAIGRAVHRRTRRIHRQLPRGRCGADPDKAAARQSHERGVGCTIDAAAPGKIARRVCRTLHWLQFFDHIDCLARRGRCCFPTLAGEVNAGRPLLCAPCCGRRVLQDKAICACSADALQIGHNAGQSRRAAEGWVSARPHADQNRIDCASRCRGERRSSFADHNAVRCQRRVARAAVGDAQNTRRRTARLQCRPHAVDVSFQTRHGAVVADHAVHARRTRARGADGHRYGVCLLRQVKRSNWRCRADPYIPRARQGHQRAVGGSVDAAAPCQIAGRIRRALDGLQLLNHVHTLAGAGSCFPALPCEMDSWRPLLCAGRGCCGVLQHQTIRAGGSNALQIGDGA